MNTYSETNYYFSRTKISFTEKDTVILEEKTLLGCCKEAFPLVAFSPKPKVLRKHLSVYAKLLFGVELIAIVSFFLALFSYPNFYSSINIPLAVMIMGVLVAASIFYYMTETKERFHFYYQNENLAFTLGHRKNDAEQKKWVDEFNVLVRNARVNFDQEHFIKIKKGVDNLEKQNLISREFADELHYRVSSVANTNIK